MTKIKHRLLSVWYCRNKRIAALVVLTALVVFAIPVFLISAPENVSGLTVKKATYNTVELSWNESDNATEYQIYRSTNKKDFEKIAETDKTTYRDKNLKTGEKYYYKVEAKNLVKSSDVGAKVAAKTNLEVPKVKTDTKKGEAKLTISSVPGAKSYDIYRNGEKIATEKTPEGEDVSFVDENIEPDKDYEYTACAVRGDAESEESEAASLEIKSIGKIQAGFEGNTLVFSWDGNDAYTKYKLYNGEKMLAETDETSFVTDIREGEYDLKLTGSNDDEQSPTVEQTFKVSEDKLPPEEVIESAISWGTDIANDNSFHYGRKSKGAQALGCYFCGTNKPGKCKKRMPADEMAKTWACCEFVTACFVHGAGVQDMDCMKAWIGTASNKNGYLKGSDNWTHLGDISYSSLKRGDVVMTKGHTLIYIGDGKCLESHGGDDGNYGSHSWNWSIGVHDYSSGRYNSKKTSVWRYTGEGSGAVGITLTELDPETKQPLQEEPADGEAANGEATGSEAADGDSADKESTDKEN